VLFKAIRLSSNSLAQMDEKERLHEAESLKRLAFFSISVSTIATLTAIVIVPSIYSYLQYIQSSLQTEVDFCQHRTNNLFVEYSRFSGEVKFVRKRRDVSLVLGGELNLGFMESFHCDLIKPFCTEPKASRPLTQVLVVGLYLY
jgi:hypothetical protein